MKSSTLKIGEYTFEYIETIEPAKENSELKKFAPQNRYNNAKKKALHEHGDGVFCCFKLENAREVSGVYAWVIEGNVVYIGETANFRKRFNMGYGSISPRNCYVGGQKTNCKMNKVVLDTYNDHKRIDIYFLETGKYKAIEKELLLSINTKYNVKNNKASGGSNSPIC